MYQRMEHVYQRMEHAAQTATSNIMMAGTHKILSDNIDSLMN